MSLWRHAAIAAERAGLRFAPVLPPQGDVIVVDEDAVVTSDALATLARIHPRPGVAVVDASGAAARFPVETASGARSVAEAIERHRGPIATVATAALRVRTPREARRAGRMLARDACKRLAPGDFFGVLMRELTLPLARLFAAVRVPPNAISVLGLLVTLSSLPLLARGSYGAMLAGALLQWLGSLMDGVDGKVARVTGRYSTFGSWLDHVIDLVYYPALFVALGVGVARRLPVAWVAGLGAAAIGAIVVASLIGVRMRRRLAPPDHPERLGQRAYALIHGTRGDPVVAFARATWRMTSRAGLPHVVLVAAILGLLPAFYVFATIGVQAVVPCELYIQRLLEDRHRPAAARQPEVARAR